MKTTAALLLPLLAQTSTPHRAVIETPGGELPFGLRCVAGTPVAIENGLESIPIQVEKRGAELCIPLPPYDSELLLVPQGLPDRDAMRFSGSWTKRGARGTQTLAVRVEPWPILVERGRGDRAPEFPLEGPPLDVAGRWRVRFEKDAQPAVGIFEADPARPGEVRGTLLTTLGDYRYLSGTARGDELALSCFDGSHAFLFRARLLEDGSLKGDFWSGASWHETWTAVRDDTAALPDPFGLTKVRPEVALADLRFPDEDGERTRVGDLLGRATLVQLFGTWCPNCGDAGRFLRELADEYGPRGLAVLGLAFEHGDDPEVHRARVAAYRASRGSTWPILIAGSSDKRAASEAFPVLDAVRAYPTTLFVDAEGRVRAVHTGFSGPATGEAHTELAAQFRARVERLLAEAEAGR